MSEAGKEYGQFVKQRREERYSQFVNNLEKEKAYAIG